jgi:voltage-gated potassium channel
MRGDSSQRDGRQAWLRQGLSLSGLLLLFYAAPVSDLDLTGRTVLSVALILLGVSCLGWAITAQVRRQLQAGRDADVQGLVMLLELVAIVFAFGYYLLEFTTPGQIVGLETRTDALYFTVSTLTTVGYGDVHAVGQLARGMVILQIVFDVVFVAALVATLSGHLRARVGR